MGESGSRTTGYTGMAVIEAATQVRNQLLAQAATRLKLQKENLSIRDGKIVDSSAPDKSWRIAEVTGKNVDAITASVTTKVEEPKEYRASFAAHFVEVEVHRGTGKVQCSAMSPRMKAARS